MGKYRKLTVKVTFEFDCFAKACFVIRWFSCPLKKKRLDPNIQSNNVFKLDTKTSRSCGLHQCFQQRPLLWTVPCPCCRTSLSPKKWHCVGSKGGLWGRLLCLKSTLNRLNTAPTDATAFSHRSDSSLCVAADNHANNRRFVSDRLPFSPLLS